MLRTDGEYVIYELEFTGNSGRWYGLSFDAAWVPQEIYTKYLKHWKAFSANGKCWQETGEHATFDPNHAMAILTSLKLHALNKEYKFRIVRRVVSQKTDVFAA